MNFSIGIVGRENVGKSTLFNQLIQEKHSIVSQIPGSTRDYLKKRGSLFNIEFDIIDTAGWHLRKNAFVFDKMVRNNTLSVIQNSDIILFIIDHQFDISNEEINLAQFLKKANQDVIIITNKSDIKINTFTKNHRILGFNEYCKISAEHKIGFNALYNKLITRIPKIISRNIIFEKEHLSVAIIGRPNAGKSTLFNRILGMNRSLVSKNAHTTRDNIRYTFTINNQIVTFIDTAGVRKKSKLIDNIEKLSINKTISAVKKSHIILHVMEANKALEQQDLTIANLALNKHALLIFVINKSDLISNYKIFHTELYYLIKKKLSQFYDVKIIYTSDKKRLNHVNFINIVLRLWIKYNVKIPTKDLNQWLQAVLLHTNLPVIRGIKLKIKYIKQLTTAPPHFTLFTNLSQHYKINNNLHKFLVNSLKSFFNLMSIPIKMSFKTNYNPYTKQK